jgi:hypothetical protein
MVEPDTPQMTIWRKPIARCIPKATDTLPEYATLTAFPQQQCLQKRASMLRYTYIVSFVELEKGDKTDIRNLCSWNVIICLDFGRDSVGVP